MRPSKRLTFVEVLDGKNTGWIEKVTDEQYQA
jgi:hypothetical protein